MVVLRRRRRCRAIGWWWVALWLDVVAVGGGGGATANPLRGRRTGKKHDQGLLRIQYVDARSTGVGVRQQDGIGVGFDRRRRTCAHDRPRGPLRGARHHRLTVVGLQRIDDGEIGTQRVGGVHGQLAAAPEPIRHAHSNRRHIVIQGQLFALIILQAPEMRPVAADSPQSSQYGNLACLLASQRKPCSGRCPDDAFSIGRLDGDFGVARLDGSGEFPDPSCSIECSFSGSIVRVYGSFTFQSTAAT